MTPKEFIKPFINEENIKNQAKLIAAGAGLAFIKPKFFQVDTKTMSDEQFGNELGAQSRKSKFGLPMFDTFIFNASEANQLKYTATKEFGGNEVIIKAPFVFETALIEVNQVKNIVKTAIAGRNGTVKEYMSEGDFMINLTGVIVGDLANYRPDINKMNELVKYLKAPLSIPITCTFLDELLISSVVIESYKLAQREGMRNVIDVEINMLSDTDIELNPDINKSSDRFTQRSFF